MIQRDIYKLANFARLIEVLGRCGVEYTVVTIPHGSIDLEPDVNPDGSVFVCGAAKMAKVAESKAWTPGSFLNPNFDFEIWNEHLGDELLNTAAVLSTLTDLCLAEDRFVRPVADNKAFDGGVFRSDQFEAWKSDNPQLLDLDVLSAPLRKIYREYRLFMIDGKVITGSLYLQAGAARLSSAVDPETIDYAEGVAQRWQPAEAFVMDVALTESGYKVIEFNNINSSGFYASDVERLIQAINMSFDEHPGP